MALPMHRTSAWLQRLGLPATPSGGRTDARLSEEGDEFVLTTELAGVGPEEMALSRDDDNGVLEVRLPVGTEGTPIEVAH
jgi:HSP20 family molecular chaperone IbpA